LAGLIKYAAHLLGLKTLKKKELAKKTEYLNLFFSKEILLFLLKKETKGPNLFFKPHHPKDKPLT